MNWLLVFFALLWGAGGNSMKDHVKEATDRFVHVGTDHSEGSGVIVAPRIVLTNFHLLEVDSETRVNGQQAAVVKVSTADDLVLLSVDTDHVEKIRVSTEIEVMDEVFYVGNPMGHPKSVVFGRVTYMDQNFLYYDGLSQPGFSGSALYDAQGRLVGLNAAMEGTVNRGGWVSLAIRAEKIKHFLGKLASD